MKKIFALFALIALFISTAFAASYPLPTGYVVDEANKLSAWNINEMKLIAANLSQESGPEVAVAIVNSISPETIESYSIKLAEKWKVGKKGQNNGVILIVAVKERKIRIEVGYGLEHIIPDSKAGKIISQVIAPKLKNGDWNGGVRDGFNSIVSEIERVK